jgi:hypothetical protein
MKNGDNLGPWGMATRGPSALSSHHGIAPLDASPGELTAKIIWAAGTPQKKNSKLSSWLNELHCLDFSGRKKQYLKASTCHPSGRLGN